MFVGGNAGRRRVLDDVRQLGAAARHDVEVDRDGLARFLAEAAQGREEQVRLVAQTIVNILPDDDSERRLLEGFLQGRDTLPDVARQGRLL